jgi:hypothetical protein
MPMNRLAAAAMQLQRRVLLCFDLARRAVGRRGWHGPFHPPDSLDGVRQPAWRGPGGRRGAIALDEPDDAADVVAVGVRRPS